MIGLLSGALALIALDALVAGRGPENFGSVLGFVNKAVAWLVDPNVPGVPNLTSDKGPQSAAGAATASYTVPTSSVPTAVAASSNPAVAGPLSTMAPAGGAFQNLQVA